MQELGDWAVEGLQMEPDHLSNWRSREFEGGNKGGIFIHRPQINKPVVWAAGTHFRMALVASFGSRTDMAAGSGWTLWLPLARQLELALALAPWQAQALTCFMAGEGLMASSSSTSQVVNGDPQFWSTHSTYCTNVPR